MPQELQIIRASEFIRMGAQGHFDLAASKAALAELILREILFVSLAATSFTLPVAIGFLKYGRLTSYHTWGAKLSAVLLGVSAPLLFAGGPAWPFRLSTVVLALAELEEIAITTVLPRWQANVPSLYHALRIVRRNETDMK